MRLQRIHVNKKSYISIDTLDKESDEILIQYTYEDDLGTVHETVFLGDRKTLVDVLRKHTFEGTKS